MEKKCLRKKDNLWVLFNGKEYCVGLTKEAQEELGAVTFASIQKAGTALKQGETLVELEAEKANLIQILLKRKKQSVNFQVH